MKYFILLFWLSSISVFAQNTTNHHQLYLNFDTGLGYTTWRLNSTIDNFKGNGQNFCITLTPYYKYKNMIVGLSYGYERLWMDTLKSTTNNYIPGIGFMNGHASFNKICLVFGYSFINRKKININATMQLGVFQLDKSFSKELIQNKFISSAAIEINYIIGKRFSVYVKPKFEFKYYDLKKVFISGEYSNDKISSFNFLAGLKFQIL